MQPVASPLTTTCARAELLIRAREVRRQFRHGRVPSATVLEHGDTRPQQKQLAALGGAMLHRSHETLCSRPLWARPGLAALNGGTCSPATQCRTQKPRASPGCYDVIMS